jgi:ABC-type amino acid transport substrate-binding protein
VTGRRAVAALAGALGVAVGVVGCAVALAVTLVALGIPAEGRANDLPSSPPPRPDELVVALSLGDPALQAGVVRGSDVILARGLEVDLARKLARRLHVPRVRFVNVRPGSRILAEGSRKWDVAIAGVEPSGVAGAAVDLSIPYLAADQAVLLRRGLTPPRSLGDLRSRVLCAVRGSNGAVVVTRDVRPLSRPLLASTSERLLQLVQTGACDAGLVDDLAVGRLVAGRGGLLGPVAMRVESGDALAIAVARGGSITLADVDRALRRMHADGTLRRLSRMWLGIDPARLRPLR